MSNTNFKILLIALLISALGILSIYSSTHGKEGEFWQSTYQRQLLWVIIGLCAFILAANFNYRKLWDWTYLLYVIMLVLLLLVFILGIVRSGAQRWLKVSWFNFQPSEIAKLIIVIFLARYFSQKSVDNVSLKAYRFGVFGALVLPFIFIAVPAGLIVEQPDLGTAILVFIIFFAMLYLSNIRLRYIIVVLLLTVFSTPLLWNFLRDYQKDRILVFLNPNIDPLGAGYTIIQSKIAIGSGHLLGKGWLSGTQGQLRFLPASHTDFIFAAFTEEMGFLGGISLLLLYFILIREAVVIAKKTSDHFARLLALGISLMLFSQVVINIAMNMGFAPIVGLPLPLMSYGGSSVVVTFVALGIVANIDKNKTVF